MRRTVLALIVASASFLGIVAAVPVRAGDGPADALAAADRHEAEGRALLERGEKVAAAKHMMEAWALRARAWSAQDRQGAADRIAALRKQSADSEAAAHELRAAGKLAEADARIQESSLLWKKAEALEADARAHTEEARKAAAARDRAATKDGAPAAQRSGPGVGGDYVELDTTDEVAARRRALEEKVKRLEAEGANLWAAGRVAEAEERMAKATAIRQELKALAKRMDADTATKAGPPDDAEAKVRKAREEKAKAEARRAAEAALAGEVKRLREQLEALKAAVEELRAKVNAPVAAPAK